MTRISTGIPKLDENLGGGLLPGTLTVVLGATGIGKTQIGVQFAHHGTSADSRSGFLLDLASRGDSQNHRDYAKRIANWELDDSSIDLGDIFDENVAVGNYLHLFEAHATRVNQRDMSFDDWHEWQAKINLKLRGAVGFIYANFVRGSRRMLVDGFEPVENPAQSVQFNLFEFLYHQTVREQYDWVARELFREHFRENAERVEEHKYDHKAISCVALCTSREQMLDDLIARPLDEGDIIANANTLILMGKTRDGNQMGRGMFIAKHRGSVCSESILPYKIDDSGIVMS